MSDLSPADSHALRLWQAALELAKTCNYEAAHVHHVTWLAVRLFDQLQTLHGLGAGERLYLQIAGILHDIGWIEGGRHHHKASLRIIQSTPLLPLSNGDRLLIGSVARYHDRTLPSLKHDHYAALEPEQRTLVHTLGGMLRLADALDYHHRRRVLDLTCTVDEQAIMIQCLSNGDVRAEKRESRQRSDLLAAAFERKIILKFKEHKPAKGASS